MTLMPSWRSWMGSRHLRSNLMPQGQPLEQLPLKRL